MKSTGPMLSMPDGTSITASRCVQSAGSGFIAITGAIPDETVPSRLIKMDPAAVAGNPLVGFSRKATPGVPGWA